MKTATGAVRRSTAAIWTRSLPHWQKTGAATAKHVRETKAKQPTNDMKAWVAEASKADTLVPSDLAMLEASMKIIERVTLKEVETKPNTAN